MSKEEQTENLIQPPSLAVSVDSSLNSGFFSSGKWPDERWWEVFGSSELNELIAQALKDNPSIQKVESRIEVAKQEALVARSRLFPLLFFNFEETWTLISRNGLYRTLNPRVSLNANLLDLSLSFTYEFDFWGKNRNLYEAALGIQRADAAEAAQVKLMVSTALAQAYFALKTNLIKRQLYQALVGVRNGILDLQVLLKEKALYSLLPPLQAEQEALEAEKLLLGIEDEVIVTRHLINVLAGKGPDAPLEIDESLPRLLQSIPLPENLSIDLLARRPDLMAQIWRVESLAHEVGAAKADFYPNINLGAFAGLEALRYGNLFRWSSKTWGLQPAIHLPIFTAGEISANIRAKKALFDEAVYEYNNLILRSAQEVADLLDLAVTVFKQKEKQQTIVADAQTRYELTALRQSSGLDNSLQNYALQEEVIFKKLADADLAYTEFAAIIKLIKALGGGYESEFIPVQAEGS